MVDFVADDRVDLMDDLLVSVQVKLRVVELYHDFGIASVHSLVDGCVDL